MNIKLCEDRHHQAMEMVDQAMHARRIGDQALVQKALGEAFVLEKEAATLVAGELELEPTRSVLHRSAASLAIQIGELREAERLIGAALAGFPPEEIAEELRDLMEQIYSKRGRKGAQAIA
jgi:hypothetical protein